MYRTINLYPFDTELMSSTVNQTLLHVNLYTPSHSLPCGQIFTRRTTTYTTRSLSEDTLAERPYM